jgi:hypothetical protein
MAMLAVAVKPHIPADVMGRFRALYDALNAERSWWEGAASLRFAAVAALTCHGSAADVAAAIRDRAEALKRRAGWFGELRSDVRFVVAALLAQRLADGDAFMDEVGRAQALFRAARLRRGGIYETLAILVLHLQGDGAALSVAAVERFRALYDEMKRYHWWLTGPDDFPCCALLAGLPGHPSEIGRRIEEHFQALSAKGFRKGDPLQTAANLLAASELPADVAAERYRGLADAFRAADVAIWQTDYDELAMLTFLKHPIDRIVERTLAHRAEVATLRPAPDRVMTFNLGAAIAFCELASRDERMRTLTDMKALADLHAMLNAQAAAAAAAAATAAAAASASAGG